MRLLTAGWVRCKASPAAEKLPLSAIATNALRLARSIAIPKIHFLNKQYEFA